MTDPTRPDRAPHPARATEDGTHDEPTETSRARLGDEATPRPLEPGTVVAGRFRVESFLAAGGMGEVYRAVQVYLKRPVALKVVRGDLGHAPELWKRFEREAQLLSQLESPHVVRVFDFGREPDGRMFLVMEMVQGETLDVLVRRERTLEPTRAVDLLTQVCAGLEEAHQQGVLHRDLKPGNIMVGRSRDGAEVAKILDFGLARPLEDAGASTLTQAGMLLGTPSYMSPEQVRADELDARSDVYALGCVAFRLLCGQPPFVADSLQRVVAMHLSAAPPEPASVHPPLAAWPALRGAVLRALRKERRDRFQSAREFSDALRAAHAADAAASPGLPEGTAFPDWSTSPEPVRLEEPSWPPPEPPVPEVARHVVTPADDFFAMVVPNELLPASAPNPAPPVSGPEPEDDEGGDD